MAFDAYQEDYLRLSISFIRSLQGRDPYTAARAMLGFDHLFNQSRDDLPQTDQDRAFHLVTKATDLLDYEMPFATPDKANRLRDEADEALGEAIGLDGACHDAKRMRALLRLGPFEDAYRYLSDNAEEVRSSCEAARDAAAALTSGEKDVAVDLAMRPYLRWEATLATTALNCGRYRRAAEVSRELLDLDSADTADARYSFAFALAKLEDEQGLDALAARCRPLSLLRRTDDPWMLLSRIALAHKRCDLTEARRLVNLMLDSFPHAALTLVRQDELSDGFFARIVVPVGGEDELILAVSEGSVLLQEGRETDNRGPLGAWIAALPEVRQGAVEDAAELARGTGPSGLGSAPGGSTDQKGGDRQG